MTRATLTGACSGLCTGLMLFVVPLAGTSLVARPEPWIAAAAACLLIASQPPLGPRELLRPDRSDRRSALAIYLAMIATQIIAILEFRLRDGGAATPLHMVAAGIGAALIVGGFALRLWAIRTLGHHFTPVVHVDAEQPVVRTGPYAWMRHPSYTGAMAIALGLAALFGSLTAVVALVALVIPAYAYRVHVEEQALIAQLGRRYLVYREQIPALLPRPFGRGLVRTGARVIVIVGLLHASGARSDVAMFRARLEPRLPLYRLSLSYPEFAALHEAAEHVSVGEDSAGALHIRLADAGETMAWVAEFSGATFLTAIDSVLSVAQAEPPLPHLAADSASRGGEPSAVVAQVRLQIAHALDSPEYESTELEGTLVRARGVWGLRTSFGLVPLRLSMGPGNLDSLIDRDVFAAGVVRTRDTLDVFRMLDRRAHTLDLFVMSLCPFARRAEAGILARLRDPSVALTADVRLHYLFFTQDSAQRSGFGCMHGEEEVRESLVQIVIRDRYPSAFLAYVEQRASSDDAWQTIARRIGMRAGEVLDVARRIERDRLALIHAEYSNVAGVCGVLDGSPTFAWEGRFVHDPREVPLLANAFDATATCSASP